MPYLVAGNGGYHNLHGIMKVDGAKIIAPIVFDDKGNDPVTLENIATSTQGFVRLEITGPAGDRVLQSGAAAAGAIQLRQSASTILNSTGRSGNTCRIRCADKA